MLLWKDYRLNRILFVMGAALLLGPYLVILIWAACSQQVPAGTFGEPEFWAGFLLMSSMPSLVFSQLTVCLLAANAVASERADRSAEFLGYLPPSRGRILASKAILVWSSAVLIWCLNVLAAAAAPWISAIGKEHFTATLPSPLWEGMLNTVATGVLLLGAGWCASCLMDRTEFATAISVVTPLLLFCSFKLSNHFVAWPGAENVQNWYLGSCLVLGPLCFAAGTVYYLRRVEP
jgi:ABC-type transport system involved in multi-copper enzyme maturation permease subunit